MQSILSKHISEPVSLTTSNDSPYDPPHRASTENAFHPVSDAKAWLMNGSPRNGVTEGKRAEAVFLGESDGMNSSLQSLPNGRASDSTDSRGKVHSRNASKGSIVNGVNGFGDSEHRYLNIKSGTSATNTMNEVLSASQEKGMDGQISRPKSPESGQLGIEHRNRGHTRNHSSSAPQNYNAPQSQLSPIEALPATSQSNILSQESLQASKSRLSSPSNLLNSGQALAGSSSASLHPSAPRLHHRHTLEVPRLSTSRTSRDFSYPGTASEGSESGHFSPSPRTPRASNTLARAPTRSVHSDMYLDEVPTDNDIAKWTETIRQKRASRRKRKEEEEDDRVMIGNKVDEHHVNWVTAYNMLTGIRFTVSRTNAKIDRELTDADFVASHKFSFDM